MNEKVSHDLGGAIPGFDAMEWVKLWRETIVEHPEIPTDDGTMLTWFSAAIMRGYDTGQERAEERGRRRGVEERDELLRKLIAWAGSPPVNAVTVSAWIHGVKYRPEDVAVWDEVRAALAPRDAPDSVTPYAIPRDEGKEP